MKVISRGPVAVGVPFVAPTMLIVPVALVAPVTLKPVSVTPSPAMTGTVVGPHLVNWPVKLTLTLLTAAPEGSRPLAGLTVKVGVAAHTCIVALTIWPPVAM